MKIDNKEERLRQFIRELRLISSKYGVAIDTVVPPKVLDSPRKVSYLINPRTKALMSICMNEEEEDDTVY